MGRWGLVIMSHTGSGGREGVGEECVGRGCQCEGINKKKKKGRGQRASERETE